MTAEQDDYVIVMTTCASDEQARELAIALLEKQLAACVQASDIRSTYRWKGAVETGNEVRLMIKARRCDYGAIESLIVATHSYETPEIVALAIVAGSRDYLSWIDIETKR
jgi:periplasmic divalent cation tolerance protein